MVQAGSVWPSMVVNVKLEFLLALGCKGRVIDVAEAKRNCHGLFAVHLPKEVPLFQNPHRYDDLLEDVFAPVFAEKLLQGFVAVAK